MEHKLLDNIITNLYAIFDDAAELAYMTGLQENEMGEMMPNVKRMVFYPDGEVFFMTKMESDEFLESHHEEGVIPLSDKGPYIVFNENHVIEVNGRRYVYGPMIVRTDFDPDKEVDLTREQIRDILDKIERNLERITYGYMCTQAFALR